MTEIIYEPYEKFYVRDVLQVDLDDFIIMMSDSDARIANWSQGVLFVCYVMTESDTLAKHEIERTTYIDRIVFAKQPKFTRTIKSTTNYEMPVVNVERSQLYSQLVTWLKVRPEWND